MDEDEARNTKIYKLELRIIKKKQEKQKVEVTLRKQRQRLREMTTKIQDSKMVKELLEEEIKKLEKLKQETETGTQPLLFKNKPQPMLEKMDVDVKKN